METAWLTFTHLVFVQLYHVDLIFNLFCGAKLHLWWSELITCPGPSNLQSAFEFHPVPSSPKPSAIRDPLSKRRCPISPTNYTVWANIQPHTSHTFPFSISWPFKARSGIFIPFQRSCKISLFPLTLNVCFHTRETTSYWTLNSIYLSDGPIHCTPL